MPARQALPRLSPKSSTNSLLQIQSLFFKIGDTNFEFTAEAQTWPKALNSIIGGDADSTYLVVADMGSQLGQGLDCMFSASAQIFDSGSDW